MKQLPKNQNDMTRILTIFALLLATLAGAAQQNLNRAIAEAEKNPKTTYVVYSEKRHPDTHKVYKSSKVMIVAPDMANKIRKAFDKDREKSTGFEMFDQGLGYQMTFTGKNERSQYVLIRQQDGQWVLTVEQTPVARPGRRNSSTEIPACWEEDADWICL